MKKFKKLSLVMLAFMLIAIANPIGASASWKRDNSGWWYTEGSSWSTGWRSIDGSWRYFYPQSGYMAIQTTVDGCYVNDNGEWVDDSNFKVKALNAEQLVRQKYYSDNAVAHTRCSGFDGSKWTIRVYEDNEFKTTNIGWYYVDINTGKITNMV